MDGAHLGDDSVPDDYGLSIEHRPVSVSMRCPARITVTVTVVPVPQRGHTSATTRQPTIE